MTSGRAPFFAIIAQHRAVSRFHCAFASIPFLFSNWRTVLTSSRFIASKKVRISRPLADSAVNRGGGVDCLAETPLNAPPDFGAGGDIAGLATKTPKIKNVTIAANNAVLQISADFNRSSFSIIWPNIQRSARRSPPARNKLNVLIRLPHKKCVVEN